jgi:hypothetical protein
MGGGNSKYKRGALYAEIRNTIKPFDLIFFKGSEFVSDMIRALEKCDIEHPVSDNFSHVGMIVTSDILDYKYVVPGKLYILESAVSGALGQGLKTVEGRSHLGVNLRDFDELIYLYDKPADSRAAVGYLKSNPFEDPTVDKDELKRKFTRIFQQVNGARYDLNPINLISVIGFPWAQIIRKIRKPVNKLIGTEHWRVCSSLVAYVYKQMGIFPETIDPRNAYPVDFLGIDKDSLINGGLPLKIIVPPTYIVSPKYYDPVLSKQEASEDEEYEDVEKEDEYEKEIQLSSSQHEESMSSEVPPVDSDDE